MRVHTFVIIALTMVLPCRAAETKFISVTPENTTFLDGSSITDGKEEVGWKWLPQEGNGGVIESSADAKRNAPPLRVTVGELKPNADYEVFGFFWAPVFDKDDKTAKRIHWPARFGFGLAALTTYGGQSVKETPWIVSTESRVGSFFGATSTLEETKPFGFKEGGLITKFENTRMIRASVGVVRTDKTGQLSVYIDDFPDSIHCERTRIDGLAVRTAPDGSIPSAGAGDPRVMHLALRAGDWHSAERELAAGADVNALDFKGFSALCHPVTYGDQKTVSLLLKTGANPNVSGQSVPVLTIAASTGNVEMVRLLLNGGAEVPAGRVNVDPRIPETFDQGFLHPAIAAIRIGSLDTLKLLLEKRPDLNLESLGPDISGDDQRHKNKSVCHFLVEDAMSQGHDELAAFLIDRGCTMSAGVFLSGNMDSTVARPHALLARSITEGDALLKTRDALLRRGVSPVRKLGPPHYSESNSLLADLEPWDGLSAAVYVGDVALARQFLLQAGELPLYYQEFLLALARWNGEPLILSLLTERFPDAGANQTVIKSAPGELASDDELRLLLPRMKPAEAKNRLDDEKWTLAVIAAPNAGGQGAVVEVQASNNNQWNVVDRQEIKAALEEAKFANPWGGGEHRFAELGDRVSADLLVLVSMVENPNIKILRFEAVDVATGLAVMREYVKQDAFDPKTSVQPLLDRIRAAFLRARAGNRPVAITLLPFSVDEKVPNFRSLAGLLRAATQAEVDATPGLLSVGLSEIKAISNEQALAGQGEFWAAAYTLEGGVAPADKGRIALTLRLQPMKGGGGRAIDQVEEGQALELPAMAARAWKKLSIASKIGVEAPENAQPDKKQSTAEAARLLREAEWLLATGLHAEAQPLLERANLLGANPELLVHLHFRALVRDLRLYRGGLAPVTHGVGIVEYPLNLSNQRELLNSIEAAQTLLDQMSYYQSRYGNVSNNWKKNEFWNTVEMLSYIRAGIPKVLPAEVSQDKIRDFEESLDQFTAEYFRIRTSKPGPTMAPPNQIGWPQTENVSMAMLRRNPELLKGWVTLFLHSSATYHQKDLSLVGPSFAHLLSEKNHWSSSRYEKIKLLTDEIAKRIDQIPAASLSLRKAELAFLTSTGENHSAAARAFVAERSKVSRRNWHLVPHWVSQQKVYSRFGMPRELWHDHFNYPLHPDVGIASLMHEPYGSMDWLGRPNYESDMRRLIYLEEAPPAEVTQYWKRHSSWEIYAGEAEKASKTPDGQNGVGRVVAAAGLWETTFGNLIHDKFAAHCKRLYMPDQDGEFKDGIGARLLTDLRQIDKLMPGMFTMPTIDNKSPERMWLCYQPFENHPYRDGYIAPLRRQPWVVGVDCSSGEIKTSVNIALAPGLDPGAANKNAIGIVDHYKGFMSQTDEMILTSVNWPGMNYRSAKVRETGVLIRKSNGELVGLNPQTTITELTDLVNGTMYAFGAVAVGNEFIAAQKTGDPDKFYSSDRDEPKQLVRISSAGAVTPITVSGRRPQLSPFDPIDRAPQMIVPDGGRVMVVHDWDYVARYTPKDSSWQLSEGEAKKNRDIATRLVTADFQKHIFSRHKIPKSEKSSELIVKWDETLPDQLTVFKGGKGECRIKINLDIPENFAKQPVFGDRIKDSDKKKDGPSDYWTYEARKGTEAYHLVVLFQTKTDLILALQIGGGFHWSPGKHTGEYLPLLWALSIDELHAAMMAQK